MHAEFIARRTGSARPAVDYLLGERDVAGKLSDGVALAAAVGGHKREHDRF